MDTVKETKTRVIQKGMHGFFFQNLSFVLKARSDDESRSYMTGLHVEESEDGTGVAICTDGLRLHMWKDFPTGWIAPGEYHVNSANIKMIVLEDDTDNFVFPNWRKIMPDKEGRKEVSMDLAGKSLKKKEIGSFSRVAAQLAIESGCIINLKFLDDLSGHDWVAWYDEPDKSVLFENKTLTALIMPMAKPN